MNYDQIRTGRTLSAQAKNHADKMVKDLEPNVANSRHPIEYEKELARLTLALNEQKLKRLPASSTEITAENENDIVIRYALKDGVSEEQAKSVLEKRENLLCSPEFDGNELVVNQLMQQAFDIVELPLREAAANKNLKRNPYDVLDADNIEEEEIVSQDTVNPFESKGIKAEHLNLRLEQLEMSPADLAKQLEIHHKTVEKWTRDGVPEENKAAVLNALA